MAAAPRTGPVRGSGVLATRGPEGARLGGPGRQPCAVSSPDRRVDRLRLVGDRAWAVLAASVESFVVADSFCSRWLKGPREVPPAASRESYLLACHGGRSPVPVRQSR